MGIGDLWNFHTWAILIEFGGALIICGYVIKALFELLQGHSLIQARLLVAEGAIVGLSFKLAGTLLKTIELHSWSQILLFCTVLALRTLLKGLFSWEKTRLEVLANSEK